MRALAWVAARTPRIPNLKNCLPVQCTTCTPTLPPGREMLLQAKHAEVERFKLEVESLLAMARRLQQHA